MSNSLSRRQFTLAATAALASASMTFPVAAQLSDPRPPTIDISDPKEIADGVWFVPDHRIWLVPNIGIILGRDAALVYPRGRRSSCNNNAAPPCPGERGRDRTRPSSKGAARPMAAHA